MAPVLKGAYVVFSVTNFLEKMDAAREITQGKAVADAAKAEGVQHLVWSSLERYEAYVLLSAYFEKIPITPYQSPVESSPTFTTSTASNSRGVHPRDRCPGHLLPRRVLHVQPARHVHLGADRLGPLLAHQRQRPHPTLRCRR